MGRMRVMLGALSGVESCRVDRMEARPVRAAPRIKRMSMVSSWSSAWWAVAMWSAWIWEAVWVSDW